MAELLHIGESRGVSQRRRSRSTLGRAGTRVKGTSVALLGGVVDSESWKRGGGALGAGRRRRSPSKGVAWRGRRGRGAHEWHREERADGKIEQSLKKITRLLGTRGLGRVGENRTFSCFDDFLISGGR